MSENPMGFYFASVAGFRDSILVRVAAQLGLADYLKEGAKTSAELSQATDTEADSLYRYLRTLAGLGLLSEGPTKGSFVLTPTGDFLRSDHPQSVRDFVLFAAAEESYRSWGHLLDSLRTGKPSFDTLYGQKYFDYVDGTPAYRHAFDVFMAQGAFLGRAALIAAYDFSSFGRLADIGGGQGAFLAAVLRQNPGLTGVLFDLPPVLQAAQAEWTASGMDDRCAFIGGTFFDSVPPGCDGYVLMRILHDWDDGPALTILQSCRAAMTATSKLLVCDQVLPAIVTTPPPAGTNIYLDLEMLTHLGGRERTEAEFSALFSKAGLRLSRVINVPEAGLAIVEGVSA